MEEDILKECNLCPRNCKVNRYEKIGYCGMKILPKIALADLHYYEEPCISGKNGSGAIFFSGCNLNCLYCQNYKISQEREGNEVSIEMLAEKMLELQEKKANNINLVTAFSFVPQIISAIDIAREKGLHLPIVYNSSGYESIETLNMLNGYIDVYLPDLKYFYKELGRDLSKVDNYFEVATKAILEMKKQVGNPVFDKDGIIQKGLIVRHLVLPEHLQNTKSILKWIKAECASAGVGISQTAADRICEYCLSDMLRIENEVSKLISFAGEGSTISDEDVNELVPRDSEYKIYEMTDYIAKKKFDKAVFIVNDMISRGETPQRILISIYNYFRRLLHVSISDAGAGKLASFLGIKEFAVKKALEQSSMFKKRALKKTVDFLEETDYKLKTGAAEANSAMWLAVFKIMTE